MRCSLFLMLALAVCAVTAGKKEKKKDNKVKVAVYYEALCPDSRAFLTTQLGPVWEKLRGVVKVKLIPYGKATHMRGADGKWKFTCQHGAEECHGNKIQACILKDKDLEDTAKVELVVCLMGQQKPDEGLQTCMEKKTLTSEFSKIQTCANSDQGDELLAGYGDRTNRFMNPLKHVPTVVINENYDEEIEKQALADLKKVICDLAPVKPGNCSN